ncbi:cysteine proteinase [Nannochloropsis gaditana]|uniref:Cysteine proteinase n=3 Tax=Nannochloropsis gaditana TaxID=72520 RepID=W7U4P2_9STRA|nr:cysteine proteinase [Nannochloropsis gaditana]
MLLFSGSCLHWSPVLASLSAFLFVFQVVAEPSIEALAVREFEGWMSHHDKVYSSAGEREQRFQNWLQAYERVRRHAHPHYSLGLNEMSDWSPKEHAKRLHRRDRHGNHMLGFNLVAGWRRRFVEEFGSNHPRIFDGRSDPPPPPEIDWRDEKRNPKRVHGVTRIRNQYYCGGCYSLGVVAAVEGVVAADRGFLNELSDEQILDCDRVNHGCEGGDPQQALQYVMTEPLVLAADYPFDAGAGNVGECAAKQAPPASQIRSYLYVQPCDERVLMQAVARSPVVVAIDASCDAFLQYAGGVLSDSCVNVRLGTRAVDGVCEDALNHAVAIVGYGTDEKTGLDYWIIKNSWGVTWGEKGFARVMRGESEATGWTTKCGLGCLEYYNFLPTGGVAFMNGTLQSDDNFLHGVEGTASQAKENFGDMMLGLACALAVCLTILAAWGGQRQLRRMNSQEKESTVEDTGRANTFLREPLLQLEEEKKSNSVEN